MNISVIIPTYKPGSYLWECLDSLVKQTFPKNDFEVLIVLNGCTEPWKSEIENFIASKMSSMNVNFIHTEKAGVSNARNIGLDNACGEYLTFIDDDDIVSRNYLENLFKISSSSCIGCSNSYCFVEDVNEMNSNFVSKAYSNCDTKIFSMYHYRSFLSAPWAKLIHKDIIKKHRFSVGLKKSEDSLFCMCISPNIRDMKLASTDTIYYQRIRLGSAMRAKQSIGIILKEHLYIEWKYISEWCKRPFDYNLLFVLSRIVACGKNCYTYVRRNM